MFQDISEYIKNDREQRRSHLDLSTACIKIGGSSFQSRMLLAHYLKTTVPGTNRIYVYHATILAAPMYFICTGVHQKITSSIALKPKQTNYA